jgi:hypothetical protein
MSTIFEKLSTRIFGKEIERRVSLAVRAVEDIGYRAYTRDNYPRDRQGYDRERVLADALEAWRSNPLARRIVELTSQYVVGGGLSIECPHERTHLFLKEWWSHSLNQMEMRCFEWCDELTRSGELFILLSTDAAGMTYVRAIPAADVAEIETEENDGEQEIFVYEKPNFRGEGIGDGSQATKGREGLLRGRRWRVYREGEDSRELRMQSSSPGTGFDTVVMHFAINRPVGARHGESDLAPLLRWLSRYAAWLEDRARLNRYRNSFLFWVKARFSSSAERMARQAELNANPPNPGSILVSDESENWSVLAPNLSSFEAAEDGLAIKKMVSAGSGIPLHFLAEPESSTRTTAEVSGDPTYRHYQQRQMYFLWMIAAIAKAAVRRRKMVDRMISTSAEIKISGSDISARDNQALASAANTVFSAFKELHAAKLIDDAELLRVVYRFAGEVVDVEEMLRRGRTDTEKGRYWDTVKRESTNLRE